MQDETIKEDAENIENADNNENELEIKMKQKQDELEKLSDRYKRLVAEFDNYKKRSAKEREILYNSLISDIVESFLPIIDSVDKAVEIETADESLKQGVELIKKQLIDALSNLGVEQIESVGKTFDPELHEAVGHVEDEKLGEKEIKEEFRKGYKIGNKVIRHSMVVVAN